MAAAAVAVPAPADLRPEAAPADGHRDPAAADVQSAPSHMPEGRQASAADVQRPGGDAPPPVTTPAAAEPARPAARGGRPAAAASRGFPRAERPGAVSAPEHHHLPGWVRRDFGRYRPSLADLLGLLQGASREAFERRIDELTAGISSGRFSLAWQYPALVEEGRRAYEAQRVEITQAQRAARELEKSRRAVADRLRDGAGLIPADAAARLNRSLRAASTPDAIAEVAAEVDRAHAAAREGVDRRRDREIARTRSRMRRTLPPAASVPEPPAETWQDVLRRFAEEQQAAG